MVPKDEMFIIVDLNNALIVDLTLVWISLIMDLYMPLESTVHAKWGYLQETFWKYSLYLNGDNLWYIHQPCKKWWGNKQFRTTSRPITSIKSQIGGSFFH